MIDPERMDPEIRGRARRLRAIDVGKPWVRAFMGVAPLLIPAKKAPGVTLTKIRERDVRVRVYRPEHPSGAGLYWIHGGGLVAGVAAMDDRFCGETARQLGVTVVSVEYRLAPKHPFPAAHDDVYTGWLWFLDHLTAWGLDRNRIAVGGQSAGGGLAAGLVQRLVDEDQPVAAQWLWTPMLDDRTADKTALDSVGHLLWDNRANRFGWNSYLRDVNRSAPPAYAVPSRRTDLTGMPPTWVYTSDIELFFDEDTEYVTRLRSAGVETALEVVPGVPHAVESSAPDTEAARKILVSGRAWLSARIGDRGVPGSDAG